MPGDIPRHLVVDARRVRDGATGVGTAIGGWLVALGELARTGGLAPWRVTVFAPAHDAARWPWHRLQDVPGITIESVDAEPECHPSGDWWRHATLPRLVESLGGGVVLCPDFACPALPFVSSRPSVRRLLMIPDALAWDHPRNYPLRFRLWHRFWARRSALSAERLLTLSPAARRRLVHWRLDADKSVGILPPTLDSAFFEHDAKVVDTLPDGSPRDRPVILYTASFEPRKNHEVLLAALHLDPLTARNPVLVFLHGGSVPAWVRRIGEHVSVVVPRSVEDVLAWTRAASVAAFPSRAEGFGMPALEAMAAGTPLVASNIPVLRWLTGDGNAARLVKPDDGAAWASALAEAIDRSPATGERVRFARKRAQDFAPAAIGKLLLRHAEAARG